MRNMIKTMKLLLLMIITSFCVSCEQLLEEDVFIEIAEKDFYKSDADALLASNKFYVKLRSDGKVTGNNGNAQQESWGMLVFGEPSYFNFNQASTDEMYVKWAAFGGFFQSLEEFQLLPDNGWQFDNVFKDIFEGVRLANSTLENLEVPEISESVRKQVRAEAHFFRGFFYSLGLSFYGELPLLLEVNTDPFFSPKQVSKEKIIEAVVKDLELASEALPVSYPDADYGRFTKGMALAWLSRFQLNQKNWQEAVNAARDVIALGVYSLSDNYAAIFAADNSGNSEIIFPIQCLPQPGLGNTMVAHTAEPNYVSGGWGGHLAREDFYNSFEDGDVRKALLIKHYKTLKGEDATISDGAMIMKYQVDPKRVGPWAGNDIVIHRYAEVILTLAEALNELEGPNQESIDLINQLRARAFDNDATKQLALNDFSSKEQLREHILNERSWELYIEGYRRDDLIRHGKFISKAKERGKNAQPHHVLYPIPLKELDRNINLDQNDEY